MRESQREGEKKLTEGGREQALEGETKRERESDEDVSC